MDVSFNKQEQPTIFSDTIKQRQQLVHNDQKKVILSGFPYDEGTRLNGGRIGGSVASKIFRKTLSKLQLYPNTTVNVYDTGDIETDLALQIAHKQLEHKHTQLLLKNQNALLVSIGGSNDQSYPNAASLLSVNPKRIGVINIDAHFDVRPLKQGKAHSGSPFRLLLQDQRFLPNGGRFVQFASKGANCSSIHYEYLQEKGAEVIWMEKDIRRHNITQGQYRTQGGQMFDSLIKKLGEECQAIFVSFDVDSINCKWMPGVSAPSVIGGLTSEQALQIVRISGHQQKVRLIDFSQFNPAVESVLSSHLLAQLFFQASMGYGSRK